MITEFFIGMGKGIALWALSLFPAFTVPSWFSGFGAQVATVLANAGNLGVWIPWAFIFIVVGASFALWGIGLFLKFVRWVLGWIPTMGGG